MDKILGGLGKMRKTSVPSEL